MNKPSLRHSAFLIIFLSGFTGLSYQIIWQRFLSFLVGSEARSIALTIGVFLCGIAIGYEFWGRITLKQNDRKALLRLYAVIEVGIGIYGLLFPVYFRMVEKISANFPSSLFFDFLYTNVLILPSAFLMGATVPLVTAFLSERNDEVNGTHTSIYSINTLGAFLGIVYTSIYGIPDLGLKNLSAVCGLINIFLGVGLFLLPIHGAIHRAEEQFEKIPHHLSHSTIYLLAFISGSVSLALEVILVRLLGLSIGASVLVFPIVLGTIVLGLGLGSFLVRNKKITMNFLYILLSGSILYLCLYYILIPYWPYWMNNIRVSLVTTPSNFNVYYILVSLLFASLTLPLIVPIGIFLPVAYALLNKNEKNYGEICGRLYFINTIGSLFGSIILGYFSLNFIDIDDLFKCLIILLFIISCLIFMKEKKYIILCVLTLILCLFLGNVQLNRVSHYLGIFRRQSINSFNFKGIFQTPSLIIPGQEVELFRDDPNSTVTVLNFPRAQGKSLIINGKSDGYTAPYDEDFPTMHLLASIPYLHQPSDVPLKAAVIGLGTGITAGFIGQFENIERVDVLEISPAVIEAAEIFRKDNFALLDNPKVFIHELDAFKFFRKRSDQNQKVDIVISEPSNPWVQGVENLYTDEFYQMTSNSLSTNGVLMQWLHIYSMNKECILLVLKNLRNNFKHIVIYQLSSGDIGILASNNKIAEINDKHFNEDKLKKAHTKIKLQHKAQIPFIAFFDDGDLDNLKPEFPAATHSQNTPILSSISLRAFFLETAILPHEIYQKRTRRFTPHSYLTRKISSIDYLKELPLQIKSCKEWIGPFTPFHCTMLYHYQLELNNYLTSTDILTKLKAYHLLREAIMIAPDFQFLKSMEKKLFLQITQFKDAVPVLIDQWVRENNPAEAVRFIKAGNERNLFTNEQTSNLLKLTTLR